LTNLSNKKVLVTGAVCVVKRIVNIRNSKKEKKVEDDIVVKVLMDSIILLKPKIIHIDNILPLIFELKKAEIISKPLFVVPTPEAYEVIKDNIVLYEGILAIDGELVFINKYKNRVLRLIYNLFVLRKYFYKTILTFEVTPYFGRLTFWLIKINRKIWQGKRVFCGLSAMSFKSNTNFDKHWFRFSSSSKLKNHLKREIKDFDAALLTYTKKQYEELYNAKFALDCPVFQVGFTRGLDGWLRFLDKNANKYMPKKNQKPYIFFILSSIGKPFQDDHIFTNRKHFIDCIEVMKEFNQDILTVFKPHAISEMNEIQDILNSIRYKNYIFSNTHPYYLVKNAKLTLSFTTSSLLPYSYFWGTPTVEYACYFPQAYNSLQGQSLYHGYIDYYIHNNKDKLKKILKKIIYDDVQINRDETELKEKYPPILSSEELKGLFAFIN